MLRHNAPDYTISKLERAHDHLHIEWSDGAEDIVHYIWLRDSHERHSTRNHQPDTYSILDIPLTIAPNRITVDHHLKIEWSDGIITTTEFEWLRENRYAQHRSPSAPPSIKLWAAKDIRQPVTFFDYEPVLDERRMLEHLRDLGFAIIKGVPPRSGMVLEVLDRFGFVRHTNYGATWEVKADHSTAGPVNTNSALPSHVDNPYRQQKPSITMLHFISNDADGGESTLVDGFYLAEQLRELDPRAFELLARTPVRYAHRDEDNQFQHSDSMIAINGWGEITHINMNPSFMKPFRVPPEDMLDFYAAYQKFARMIENPANQLETRLEPGDLLILNNLRVLHGRRSFSCSTSSRIIEGCFSDIDGFLSKLAVLQRQPPAPT
ncbi:MAG: TauD/TfdA family dioxygenase [Myxococcota bacterium]